MREACSLQHFTRRDEACRIKTEFRVLATAGRPFASAFAIKTYTNADVRFDAHFLCRANRLLKLFEFFCNDHDFFVQFAPKQSDPDKGFIFVAVADDKTFGVFMHGQGGDQLWFASSFKAKMKLFAGIDDLLDDLTQLVDLNRKNAAIFVFVIELSYRHLKRAVDRLDAVTQQVLKPNHQGETEISYACFVNYCQQVDAATIILQRSCLDVARAIHRKIALAPTIHIVCSDGRLEVPLSFHFGSFTRHKIRETHIQSLI